MKEAPDQEALEAIDHHTSRQLSFQLPVENGLTRQCNIPGYLLDPALIIAPHATPALASQFRGVAARLFPPDRAASKPVGGMQSAFRERIPSRERIFVTSPHQGDGKTCTAFNLAWTLAQAEKTVLLVELNFVHPRLRAALGDLRLRYGLEGALRGKALAADAVFSLDGSSLYIAAVRNPTPASDLAPLQANLDSFFAWAAENFDILVVDCPSALSPEWNAWFRNSAHPALLVTREDHTPRIEVQRAAKLLDRALTSVLVNAARRVPSQLAAQTTTQLTTQHQPWRISPAEEVSPSFLQNEPLEVATVSERKN